MLTRLREIRKTKGLTLQQVAERADPPTTAQTIGRLETGVRTLSVGWIDRIAAALEVAPEELIALPEGGDIDIWGAVGNEGKISAADGYLRMQLEVHEPVAVRIDHNQGSYLAGDTLICSAKMPQEWGDALGKDCVIEDGSGKRYFGKLTRYEGGAADLACHTASGGITTKINVVMLAVAVYQLRSI